MALDIEQAQTRATEIREQLFGAAAKLTELRAKPAADRGDTYEADVRSAVSAIHSLDPELTAYESAMRAVPQFETRGRGPSAATQDVGGPEESVSLGRLVSFDEKTQEWRQRGHGGVREIAVGASYFNREYRAAHEMRAVIDEADTGSTDAKAFLPIGQPFLAPQAIDRQRLFVQDIVPGGTTALPAIPYIRELNPRITELGATSVAEGATKPEVTHTFETVTALVKKVAAWVHLTDEIVNDAPTLMAYINGRLPYMVDLALEKMVLFGNPSVDATNFLGIINTPGVQTAVTTSGDPAVTLGKVNAQIENVDGVLDGYVLNPTDYWTMVTRRHVSGDTAFDSASLPFGLGPQGAWGVPVIRTRGMTAGKFLGGNFRLGAQILHREETNVKMGWINDDFVKNLQVVLAELRATCLVFRPDFFSYGSL